MKTHKTPKLGYLKRIHFITKIFASTVFHVCTCTWFWTADLAWQHQLFQILVDVLSTLEFHEKKWISIWISFGTQLKNVLVFTFAASILRLQFSDPDFYLLLCIFRYARRPGWKGWERTRKGRKGPWQGQKINWFPTCSATGVRENRMCSSVYGSYFW